METEIVMTIGQRIVEYVFAPIERQSGYLFSYKTNVAELKIQVEKLGHTNQRVQHSIDEAKTKGEEIEKDVKKWLETNDGITREASKLVEDARKAKTSCSNWSCPNLKSRYQLSRKASKMIVAVSKIEEEGRSFDARGVSYRVAPQGIGNISIKGYVAFESRMSTLKGVIEALNCDDTNMIGVYGMGGIGKTMLVNEVARQVKQDKLFDKVVMTVVSQTPNIKEIQRVIFNMLGLQFDNEESIERRAERLGELLKTHNKILVIVDDIWEKLDLEAVGIFFGDDQKKCKLLFTSRFEDVLCNDMGIQKNFNLGVLLYDEARNLFRKIVGSLAEDQDFDRVAVDVVKECAGLPIAIRTIANALMNKNLPVWKDAVQQLRTSNPTNIKGMPDKVYHSIELSYNFLKSEEAKALFLLCSLYEEDANIKVDSLLRYGMGLDLFQDVYHLEAMRDRVYTLVEILKSSSLLLSGDEDDTVKMHDIIRDVAIHIAAKDRHMLVIGNADNLQEWSKKKKLKDSTAISLPYTDFCELPERLECPQLMLFLLFNKNISWQIPHPFFEGMKELRVLNLTGMLCPHLPSSLSFLQNLQTLCLDDCELEDIALIGELKELKVLSLSNSNIEQLPKQIRQLTHLQVLDLSGCYRLKVIPPNILSNLKMLEELYMKNNFTDWEVEGKSSEGSNARLTELDHLSRLNTLDINIPSTKLLSNALIFAKLVKYKISIGDRWSEYWIFKSSRSLKLKLDISFQSEDGIKILLKSCKDLYLEELMGVQNILYELNPDGFPLLKHLTIQNNAEIQYIIHSMGPPQSIAFPVLESFSLYNVTNLENVCHGLLAMGSFQNLREVKVESCDKLKFVVSSSMAGCLPQLQQIYISRCMVMGSIVVTEREDEIEISNNTMDMVEFTQLRYLKLQSLPMLMCFRFDVDSRILFNQKVSFPSLEDLILDSIDNIENIWHDQLPLMSTCFQNLTKLRVYSCDNLKCLSSSSMTRSLVQLKDLSIRFCEAIEEILVTKESSEEVQTNMKILFPKLEYLELQDLPKLTRFCSENSIELPSLKKLKIDGCLKLKTFNNELEEMNNSNAKQSLFNEKVSFPKLECLKLISVDNIEKIWHDQLPLMSSSFQKLTELIVENCDNLKCLSSSSVTRSLLQLKNLQIHECEAIEEILVTKELGEEVWMDNILIPKVESLELRSLPKLMRFCSGNLIELPSLKNLEIHKCCELNTFISNSLCKGLTLNKELEEMNNHSAAKSLFNENVALPNLEIVKINSTANLRMIWHHQLVPNSFCKLKEMVVENCESLKSLFPTFVTKHLTQLEKLEIDNCGVLEDIVAKEEGLKTEPKFVFPQLTSFKLYNLSELKSFYPEKYTLDCPSLKVLETFDCAKVKVFASNSVSFQETSGLGHHDITIHQPLFWIKKDTFANLQKLGILEWNDAMNETWHGQFPADFFCKLKTLRLNCSYNEFSLSIVQRLCNLEDLSLSGAFVEGKLPIFLRKLRLYNMPKLMHLWREDSQTGKVFQNLEKLHVLGCDGLKNLGPFSIYLPNLKTLKVNGCKNITEIVADEGGDAGDPEIVFNQLTSLELSYLPRLTSFYPGNCTMKFQSLDIVNVIECPELKIFSQGVLSTPALSILEIKSRGVTRFYPDLENNIKQF